MNEIEKMYKKCDIKKCRLLDRDHKLKWVYPPFTAEKQLNLIKWLIQKDFYDERIIRSDYEQTYFYCTYIDDYGDYCAESCKKMNNAFQDAHKGILKENEELKNILKDIDKKLELALDVEQTDAEESFDLLYEIQEIITEAIGE